jgi:hypothetical protein
LWSRLGRKLCIDGAKMAPRVRQDGLRRSQMTPRWGQTGAKRAPKQAKTRQHGAQIGHLEPPRKTLKKGSCPPRRFGPLVLLGSILGPAWVILGPSWAVGAVLGPSWAFLGPSKAILSILGPSRGRAELSCKLDSLKKASWCENHIFCIECLRFYDAIMGRLGLSWGHLGAILGRLWAILGRLGTILGPSWGHLGPSWDHLGPS